jgi:hypothetical protein
MAEKVSVLQRFLAVVPNVAFDVPKELPDKKKDKLSNKSPKPLRKDQNFSEKNCFG